MVDFAVNSISCSSCGFFVLTPIAFMVIVLFENPSFYEPALAHVITLKQKRKVK